MNLSLVIPFFNEEESLTELHDWIVGVMQKKKGTATKLFLLMMAVATTPAGDWKLAANNPMLKPSDLAAIMANHDPAHGI